MTRRKYSANDRLLTDVELELMSIIWERGDSTVKEVMDALPGDRDLAYTSVATILKILENKKVLGSRREERAHVYYSLVPKSTYELKSIRDLVDKLFAGTSSSLVVKLLNESKISQDELKSIRNVLNERLKQ